MKKLKVFILVLISCLVTCFAFSGCISGGAHYVKGSTFCSRIIDGSRYRYDVTFDVEFPQDGYYNIYYVIFVLNEDSEECYSQKQSHNVNIKEGDEERVKTISGNISLSYNCDETSVKIRDIKIVKDTEDKDLRGVGIGFGVALGVIIVGLIVLFVLEKKGKIS